MMKRFPKFNSEQADMVVERMKEMLIKRPIRKTSAKRRPMRLAAGCRLSGRRSETIARKITLSMPRMTSSTDSVARLNHVLGSLSNSSMTS